jgi:hypothetical protein
MELHGSLSENLSAALKSMRRLKGHPVHADTIDYWYSLVTHVRGMVRKGHSSPEVKNLLAAVSLELAGRLEARAPTT